MKNSIAIVAALGVLIAGAIVLNQSETAAKVRVVRLDASCPDLEDTDNPCHAGQFQRVGYCLCLSSRDTIPGEQKPEQIPVCERKRKVLRCDYPDPETGVKSHVVRTEPVTMPSGGAIIIEPNLEIDASFHCIEGPLLKKMQAFCCQDCPGDCWVSAGNWSFCPTCKCDGTCGNYCPKPEGEI